MIKKEFKKIKVKSVSVGAAMADMAMLLLIFFMTTTTTEPPQGVELDPPAGIVKSAEQESLYITVSKFGQYYCDGEPVTLERIKDILALRSYEKETPVSITADKNLKYQYISELLKTLQEGDFLNVTFMAEEKSTDLSMNSKNAGEL
ncbi:MAG: biopolymer transporter ExbD [Spirochaetia bacterium]|nr:biopolymer transporter ExbD [Spirochaetia bacterium]